MKQGIHPDYRKVMFVDTATGDEWISRSTMSSAETREVDGEELPVIRLEISSYSHPFWTGTMRELDADGKIDRFRKRYGKKSKPKARSEAKPSEVQKSKPPKAARSEAQPSEAQSGKPKARSEAKPSEAQSDGPKAGEAE